jgi:branched-chain amino acid transport system permease protein
VIPILEIVLFAVFAAAPIMLEDYLTIFVTRVLILALLALSFDLIWGYSGIMSFGQALFFGAADTAWPFWLATSELHPFLSSCQLRSP